MRLSKQRPTNAAQQVFACACLEAAAISFAVGVEHLVLACAVLGSTLNDYVDADDVRACIVARERDALASLGISRESVRGELEERHGEELLAEPYCMPITPETKRMLELATRRRRRVTPDEVLGTLVHQSSTARRLLVDLDVPVATLQARLTG